MPRERQQVDFGKRSAAKSLRLPSRHQRCRWKSIPRNQSLQPLILERFFVRFPISAESSKVKSEKSPLLNYFAYFFRNSTASSASLKPVSMANIAFGQYCLTSFITFFISIVPLKKPLCSSLLTVLILP